MALKSGKGGCPRYDSHTALRFALASVAQNYQCTCHVCVFGEVSDFIAQYKKTDQEEVESIPEVVDRKRALLEHQQGMQHVEAGPGGACAMCVSVFFLIESKHLE